ncbi:MAG: hypothetical protein WDM81_04910, partial [Rhizomicrobium sp.]
MSIAGHTESAAFEGPGGMTNWELSSARANAARALLAAGGLVQDRVYEVAGKAGSEPLLPEDPNARPTAASASSCCARRRRCRRAINSDPTTDWRSGPEFCHSCGVTLGLG